MISATTTLYKIGPRTILRLPDNASALLPSRGQTMVEGTLNGFHFLAPLEPDGKGSHWLDVEAGLQKGAKAVPGDTVELAIEPTKEWIEPEVPTDLLNAVRADAQVAAVWQDITPMARWEWVRWVRSTNSPETRKRRVEVTCSKIRSGKRRPCCWNRNLSTDPAVSKGGILLGPPEA